MSRFGLVCVALASLAGCQVLSPKPTLVGTWSLEGTKFMIPGTESALGTATYTADRFTFDVTLDLAQSQGTIELKVEGTYLLDGENYHHTIEKITPNVDKVVGPAREFAAQQCQSPEVRALLNQIGTAKAKFVSENQVTISGNDKKTIKLLRSGKPN